MNEGKLRGSKGAPNRLNGVTMSAEEKKNSFSVKMQTETSLRDSEMGFSVSCNLFSFALPVDDGKYDTHPPETKTNFTHIYNPHSYLGLHKSSSV